MEDRTLLQRLIAKPELGPAILLALELAVFYAINPDFLSVLNISNTLAFTVELGLIALAMTRRSIDGPAWPDGTVAAVTLMTPREG